MLVSIQQFQQSEKSGAIERRRGIRVRQARPVKVFHPAARRFLPGKTHDISATGLRIELPLSSTVTSGALLSIHVGLSPQGSSLANRRQMIPARVVWVKRPASGEPACAGLEFVSGQSAHQDAA